MEFEFIAGDPALDFIATVAERTTTQQERLTTPRDLADWLVQAGVVDSVSPVDVDDLRDARELREALYRFTVCLTQHTAVPARTRATINRYAAVAPPVVTMTAAGSPRLIGSAAAALAALARSGINLGSEALRAELAWCADHTCTRPFLDRSRGKRRRWCGMSGCGDRAKAAAYRRRQHGASAN